MIFTKRKLQNDCQLPYVRTDMTFFFVCERGGSIISALLKGAFDWGQDEIQAYVSTGYDAKKMKRICHLPSSIFSINPPPLSVFWVTHWICTPFSDLLCICVKWVSVCGDHSYVCIVPIHAWKNKSSRFCPHLIVYKLSNVDLSYYPWRQTSFRLSFPPFHLLDAHAF